MKRFLYLACVASLIFIFVTAPAASAEPKAPFSIYIPILSAAPDVTPPVVSSTSPVNGATGVSISAVVTVTFSEAIQPATVTSSNFQLRNASNSLVAAGLSYDATQKKVTITPNASLGYSAFYGLTVKGGTSGVKDLAGNAMSGNQAFSFTTVASPGDTTPPTVSSTSPANGATGVSISAAVTVTFSELIQPATVTTINFQLLNASNSAVASGLSYDAAQGKVTITPNASLGYSSSYSVTVKGGTSGVKDLAGNAMSGNQTYTFTTEANPVQTNEIIADHTRIAGFASIPAASLQAAEGIKTLFMHQSTGNNIDFMGLQCLEGLHNDVNFPPECVTLAQDPAYSHYDSRNWTWQEWATPMADAIAKTDMWVGVATAQQANYQVLGMKFCYIDGWNIDFSYYKTKMEQLEQAYPGKTFIWSTSAIWAESTVSTNLSAAQQTQTFNQQVRAYALANHKVLYDIADIESHDPSGNACQSNGVEALCDVYYTGWGGGGGGHPNGPASLRLAEGFWWLMARISGWDGN